MSEQAHLAPIARTRKIRGSADSSLGDLIFYYPLIIDSVAFIAVILTEARQIYQFVQLLGEMLIVSIALLGARRSAPQLYARFGLSIYLPALLFLLVALACFARGNDNTAFPLAAFRYIFWLLFAMQLPGATRNGTLFWSAAKVLAILSVAQLLGSTILAGDLQNIHGIITGDASTNAVLTSIALGKNFASLTLRNPIELSYMGVALLCIALSEHRRAGSIVCALVLVVCGRSNMAIISAALIMLVDSISGKMLKPITKLAALALLICICVFTSYLPQIYLSEDATWEDFIQVLSYQRLGMLIAIPELISQEGGNILALGMSASLQDSVDALFSSGILPPLFEDGGAIAIFDVVWIGMLVVGGIPFLAAGIILLTTTFRAARRFWNLRFARALYLYATACVVMSFSSQVLLSRYGLFFLCFIAANFARQANSKIIQ